METYTIDHVVKEYLKTGSINISLLTVEKSDRLRDAVITNYGRVQLREWLCLLQILWNVWEVDRQKFIATLERYHKEYGLQDYDKVRTIIDKVDNCVKKKYTWTLIARSLKSRLTQNRQLFIKTAKVLLTLGGLSWLVQMMGP